MDAGILRIIDANFNRAGEGLRVVEELVRFDLNNQDLSKRLKGIRHAVSSLIDEAFDSSLLILARDSPGDVGLNIQLDSEDYRTGRHEIIRANMKRVQEAMRVLEEFTKSRDRGAGTDPCACPPCDSRRQSSPGSGRGDSTGSRPASASDSEASSHRQECLCMDGSETDGGYHPLEAGVQHCCRTSEGISRRIKALRYDVYSLEQEVLSAFGRKSIQGLYLILDYGLMGEAIRDGDYVGEIIAAGVDVVQLRVKDADMPDSRLVVLANMLREITGEAGIPLIINDRVDIALAVNADGVHLGQDDMPVNIARKLIGNRLIGISTHNPAQAQQAAIDGADYLGIGPVYETTTKPGQPIGCKIVRDVCNTINLPIIAIGGINQDNLGEVLNTGVQGIAVVSAILKATDPVAATRMMADRVGRSRTESDRV